MQLHSANAQMTARVNMAFSCPQNYDSLQRKHLADLEKVRQAEIQIQQAEEKRHQEIVKEMVHFRSVC